MPQVAELLKAPGAGFEAEEDFEAFNEYCRGRGWTDGLPVVPPTPARVERMLAYCDRPWDQPIAKLPPRYGAATPLRLAANAVMAGCAPEHFPLVMLALDAMAEEPFNLYGIQATTHSCAPLLIFNGPVARELGINAGHSAFGPGTHSNATIGRAVRLALVNIGGAIPGVGDMATYGTPTKYSYCAAENEAASPWEPLHVERGFPAETTTVTVLAAEGPHNINDHESTTALGMLKTMAGTLATTGVNDIHHPLAEPCVLFCPEHAAMVAAAGYSKKDVKQFLFEHAHVPLGRFSDENADRRLRIRFAREYAEAGPDARVPVVKSPDRFLIVVIGGAGKHSAFIPTFGNTRPVTRMLQHADGRPVHSIAELRRG
jgi:hypothetical protein